MLARALSSISIHEVTSAFNGAKLRDGELCWWISGRICNRWRNLWLGSGPKIVWSKVASLWPVDGSSLATLNFTLLKRIFMVVPPSQLDIDMVADVAVQWLLDDAPLWLLDDAPVGMRRCGRLIHKRWHTPSVTWSRGTINAIGSMSSSWTFTQSRWCLRNALNEKKSYTMILCRPKLISKRTPKSVSQFAPSLWFHIGMFRACFLMIRGWSATHNRTQMTTHSQHSFWQSYNNLRHNATPQHRLSHCTLHSACHNPKHLSR